MADDQDSQARAQPRRCLVDASQFGRDPNATWQPVTGTDSMAEVLANYWHHLVVCQLRAIHGPLLHTEVARRLGREDNAYLRGQLSGRYTITFGELLTWVIAFGDISVLPVFDASEDLHPPGARPSGG